MTNATIATAAADASFEALWPRVRSHTLLGRHKARSLYDLVATVPPHLDVAECGVFRGGMVLMMALQSANMSRRIWAFDSFEGLPGERHPGETCYYQTGALQADESCVRDLLAENHAFERVCIRKGNFESTLNSPEIPQLGLVHVDCDVYTSAKVCIDRLYDRLAPGGIMVFDDYFDLGGGVSTTVNEHLLLTGEILHAGPVEQAYVIKGLRPEGLRPEGLRPEGLRPEGLRLGSKTPEGPRPEGPRPEGQGRTIPTGDPQSAILVRGTRETIWPAGIFLDVSNIVLDQEYLRDLVTGEAVPDLPGGSVSDARRYAERMLRVCDYHKSIVFRIASGS